MTQQTETIIELKVDVQTFNAIIAALDEMPHKMARRVIDNLAQQAQAQVGNGQQQGGAPSNAVPAGPMAGKVIQ